MALVVKEAIMAEGDLAIDVNHTPELWDLLWDEANNRPHTWFMLVKDPADIVRYPPFVLRRVDGDERGLAIGGPGILWTLGSDGIGPTIEDREYLSGADMLSNGTFALGDQYWRRPSEGSLWVVEAGTAENAGGLRIDDVWEYDFDFPARPGNELEAIAAGLLGTGNIRVRILLSGRFNPPNLLTNGDFDEGPGGGWGTATHLEIVPAVFFGGEYALRVVPIPKPQLVTGPDFSTGWTLGSTMTEHDDFLWITETPKPQYIPHAGAGDFTSSPYVTYDNADASKAVGASGYYRQVGPIGQHQVVANPSFESGLTGWIQAAGAWSTSSATFVDGANSATTGGVAGGALKSLQATAGAGPGVDPFTWAVGEEWQFDGDLCSGTKGTSDEADGEAHLRVYLVDVNYPANDSHLELVSLQGAALDAAEWHHGQQRYSVQADKTSFVPMATVYGHENGSWYVDNFRATRIRGNNTGIYSAVFTAIPNQRYTFSTLFVTSDANIGGSITLRLIFSVAAGGIDVEETVTLTPTIGQWKTLSVEGTCPKGYDRMRVAIDGDDIVGGSFYVDADYTVLWKSDNNTDRTDGTPFAVVPAQRYAGGATIVRQAFIEHGTVRVGVVLSGPAVSDEIISVEHSFGEDTGAATRITFDITPPAGYDTATPFVLAKDLAGGDGTNDIVAITAFTVEKSDNNSDAIAHDAIDVTPERELRWTQKYASDENLQRGTVQLVARCVHPLTPTFPDQTFVSSAMAPALDESFQTLELNFSPPSGYASVVCSIVATDVEGSNIFIDQGEIRDTDTATLVFDTVSTDPAGASPVVTAAAPAGTESVRVAVVVEAGSTVTALGAVSLVRTDQPPATGDDIVPELLTSPTTHQPLSIGPGTISCPETIPSDWHLVNLTNREALDHYCTVVSDPPREYRVTATDPPLLDVAERSVLFVDHTPDHATSPVVLVDAHIKDPDVTEIDPPEVDVTDRPSEIKVIGADRHLVSGSSKLVGATRPVPVAAEFDYHNREMRRTQIVSAGTVDHERYARALAEDLAAQAAAPAGVVTVTLNEIDDDTAAILGIDARPAYAVGDDIYAFKPTAGLVDSTNPVMIAGRQTFPAKKRVLERVRSLPEGWTVVMRRPDGFTMDLPGVIHGPDQTSLMLGERLPEWKVDPQGKAEGVQYLRDRASRPR